MVEQCGENTLFNVVLLYTKDKKQDLHYFLMESRTRIQKLEYYIIFPPLAL
jgi:hypothetical protein